jgi:hypothetical protein
MQPLSSKFVLCIDNDYYKVSLEKGKVYQVLPDAEAEVDGLIRVVDESGEDYLYAISLFVAIELPQVALDALLSGKN